MIKPFLGIVNSFVKFFESVYVLQSSSVNTEMLGNAISSNNILFHPIAETETTSALKKLKNIMTSGPDGILSFLVKDCAIIFSKPLTTIFNLSLKFNIYPDRCIVTRICPVLKKGDKTVIENYRSISLLCNFSKVFEIVLYQRIYHIVVNQVSPYQHGFVRDISTTTNLDAFAQYISEVIDKRGQMDVIHTDFSKGYDFSFHQCDSISILLLTE